MDSEIVALASTGASTIVALMATDSWHEAKSIVVGMWHKDMPEKKSQIDSQLVATRQAIVNATESMSQETARQLERDWAQQFSELLQRDTEAVATLRHALEDRLQPALSTSQSERGASAVMRAVTYGQSRAYQAGRDQHINEK
jgi:phosphoglycerate-specific signal transduction histidine kinase